jgi:hypothetical protein
MDPATAVGDLSGLRVPRPASEPANARYTAGTRSSGVGFLECRTPRRYLRIPARQAGGCRGPGNRAVTCVALAGFPGTSAAVSSDRGGPPAGSHPRRDGAGARGGDSRQHPRTGSSGPTAALPAHRAGGSGVRTRAAARSRTLAPGIAHARPRARPRGPDGTRDDRRRSRGRRMVADKGSGTGGGGNPGTQPDHPSGRAPGLRTDLRSGRVAGGNRGFVGGTGTGPGTTPSTPRDPRYALGLRNRHDRDRIGRASGHRTRQRDAGIPGDRPDLCRDRPRQPCIGQMRSAGAAWSRHAA